MTDVHMLIDLLTHRGQTLATCESLTAGAVAARCADVPGASAVLRGGLVTYSAELKTSLAGVDAQLIADYGVVSAECAAAMAHGARTVCASDWAVALTGVAGPGPADGHAAGDVYIAVAGPTAGSVQTRLYQWPGCDRADVRQKSIAAALFLLHEIVIDS